MKIFNTAGPVNMPFHYKIDPLHRWDLNDILLHIKLERYFILHAPRQTGKTSSLLALQEYLNNSGEYFAIYATFELGQACVHNVKDGVKAIISQIKSRAEDKVSEIKNLNIFDIVETAGAENALKSFLSKICDISKKPVVLLADEVNTLIGDTLISVLRQLKDIYEDNDTNLPVSMILCCVKDLKDEMIKTSKHEIINSGSILNIDTESLTMRNFSKDEINHLLQQHTECIEQRFNDKCLDVVFNYTDGQPWLVNALLEEATSDIKENRNPSVTITPEILETAKQNLVISKEIHLDQIVNKLDRDWMKRIILPMILGEKAEQQESDIKKCIELNLVKYINNCYQIANPIYKDIIIDELTNLGFDNFLHKFRINSLNHDGSLNVKQILNILKEFWNEESDIPICYVRGYQDATPQLFVQAFLRRVANGNGFVNREYGLGKGRTDIMLKWQYDKEGQTIYQKIVMELKVINQKQSYDKLKQQAIEQTAKYAKTCGTKEAHILIFDRHKSQNWQAD